MAERGPEGEGRVVGGREERRTKERGREGVRRAGDIKLEGCHVPLRWITR